MVIGWICSRGHFETAWEGLHEVLPIVIAKESFRVCFLCNFEPLVSHTNVHEIMASFLFSYFLIFLFLPLYWHNASLVLNATTPVPVLHRTTSLITD